MSLKVIVFSASKLINVDITGQSDPFVVLGFRGREQKTIVKYNTLEPKWEDAKFQWKLGTSPLSPDDILSVKVRDYDLGWFKELLGQVDIPLGELRQNMKIEERYYNLSNRKNIPIQGKIKLGLEYIPPNGDGQQYVETSEDGDEDIDAKRSNDEITRTKDGPKVKKRRKTRRHLPRQWSDKEKDFQISVHVLEGRHLPGTNIHPVVRATVAGQPKVTSVKRSTNRPVFKELLSFSFHTSEAELFNKLICFEVFNSGGVLRSDTLLGSFKCDIWSVYERKGHSFVRKWIMLSKPDGKSEQGYLKVTAVVLATGDKPPVGVDTGYSEDEDEEINSNCLMPLDVPRRVAVLVLKVYQANDLPRMDSGVTMTFKKFFKFFSRPKETGKQDDQHVADPPNLVDPFLVFSFGGKEVKTDVKYNDSNPRFNQVLKLPFEFPTMCGRLKLQLIDWDQGPTNDFIATAFLSVSSISDPGSFGNGSLPQFGPCFLNFYGSPREYHNLPDNYDYLNRGIGEGVAFRGRVLIELSTLLTANISSPVCQMMPPEEDFRVKPYMKQSQYTLFACFHEATMVTVHHGPIEFEVSIGNNGTKFDETVAPSNTSPCNAVYDGSHYHYLPWGRKKPCVWIECAWEDIAFRIEPMNILGKMRADLKRKVEEAQKDTGKLLLVLEQFIDTFRKELERFQERIPKILGKRNALDDQIHQLRIKELKNLARECSLLKREKDTEKVMEEMKTYLNRIKSVALEPQLSMPDVILWMICGGKRIAYYRMPAHHVLFSQTGDACGKFCGKTIDLKLKYPGRQPKKHHPEILAMVRLEVWLGLVEHQHHWTNREGTAGEFKVFAETFENETKVTKRGKSEWVPVTSDIWPHFSDYSGNLELPKKSFQEPKGWQFCGEWKNAQGDLQMFRQQDKRLLRYTDVVCEHQTRKFPGGSWEPAEPTFTDHTSGDDFSSLPTDPPRGWRWEMDRWIVDVNRAVDHEGWEYSPHSSYTEYTPIQRAYHLYRRRWLTRSRKRHQIALDKDAQQEPLNNEGWEYAQTFHENFHPKESRMDSIRRKRLLKEIVPKSGKFDGKCGKFPVFENLVTGQKKKSNLSILPRMFVTFPEPRKYRLDVSIYQARDLVAQDKSGSNDPYVLVTFTSQSQKTRTLSQTPSPTWDQTLIFQEVEIFEDPSAVKENPPSVVMEIFDEDQHKQDFLGRCIVKPKVKLSENDCHKPNLTWYKIRRGDEDGGQILAECELFLSEGVKLPTLPSASDKIVPVRPGVRPEMQKMAIEIICLGVRNLKDNPLFTGLRPSVEFECNQTVIATSEVIKDLKRCPNFPNPVLQKTTLNLPKNDIYAPPINIRVFHNGTFGRSLIGLHVVRSLREFEIQPKSTTQGQRWHEREKKKWPTKDATGKPDAALESGCFQRLWRLTAVEIGRALHEKDYSKSCRSNKRSLDAEHFDWWSKYDASRVAERVMENKTSSGSHEKGNSNEHIRKYLAHGYDTLKIYPCKLEDVPEFEGFDDFITTFPLRKGKTKSSRDYNVVVGELKGSFRIYRDTNEISQRTMEVQQLPSSEAVECLVRVYVVRAWHLQPKDVNGLADPYLVVSLGNKTYDEAKNHLADTLNPIFGSYFEFKAKIPLVKDLKIVVMDHDPAFDDVIGETVIDLEQRLLSGYHATCGLPKTYFISGPCKWRESLKPLQVLAKRCTLTGKSLKLEKGNPDYLYVGNIPYTLSQFEDGTPPDPEEVGEPLERLALHVLHSWNLVPEHVETRALYNNIQPDIEQGELEMWVEIFSKEDECFLKDSFLSSSFVTALEGEPSTSGTDKADSVQVHTIVDPSQRRRKTPELGQLLSIQPPLDISPRLPLKFELRVVVWSTTDVLLDEKNFAGEEMSDIFVRAWIDGINEKQETSVHERSFDGNGSFNWRMVFRFLYLPIEKEIVVRDKTHFLSFDVKEQRLPPILKFQIWDKDRLTWSDFLGQEQLNLAKLTRPCIYPRHCGTSKDPARQKLTVDLFALKEIRGWWACYNEKLQSDPTGKVDMTLQILQEAEAIANPVGLGQKEPNQYPVLPKPIRPSTSFLWYLAPMRTCRHIIWKNQKRFFIKLLLALFLVLFIASFVYNVPGYVARKVIGV